MEEAIFKTALASVTSGDYCESDIKVIKEQIKCRSKQELALKKKKKKDTNYFVKKKKKNQTELKIIRNDIKSLKNILKEI